MDKLILQGTDNYGQPRQRFADRLAAIEDEYLLIRMMEDTIWLSAFAANNRRSDYHWQAIACNDEAKRRGKPDLYTEAYKRARATMG